MAEKTHDTNPQRLSSRTADVRTQRGDHEDCGKQPARGDLPAELSRPARRALAGAGIVNLEQLTTLGEAEVLELHGVGPKALGQLSRALKARGQTFADGKSRREHRDEKNGAYAVVGPKCCKRSRSTSAEGV